MNKKQKIRLVINTPNIRNSGGVANFYRSLSPFLGDDVRLNFITYSLDKKPSFLDQIALYLKFILIILKNRNASVLLNPSFNYKAVRRDAIFILMAYIFNSKTVIFWHGWRKNFYDSLISSSVKSKIFKSIYNIPIKHFVLASEFGRGLNNLGIQGEIVRTTTCVENGLIEQALLIQPMRPKREIRKVLFLSRIEPDKGIYEALDAFRELKSRYPFLSLTIAGAGVEQDNVSRFISEHKIEGVEMLGYVKGSAKARCYLENDLLLFPSYTEGMPLTLLEAMCFGLVLITTKVGGVKDFFNENMGGAVDVRSTDSIVNRVIPFLENKSMVERVSAYNIQFAKERFMAKDVANSLKREVINS